MNEKLNTEAIRQMLNRSSAQLGQPALARLRDARAQALARYDARSTAPFFVLARALTGAGHAPHPHSHRNHYYWAIAILLAAFLYSGATYWQHVADNSDVDIAILTDDLPIDAYVD